MGKALLQLHRSSESLPGRGEHHQGLVSSNLEQDAFAGLNHLGDQTGERGGEFGSGLIAVLLCVLRVAADVSDQEGVDIGTSTRFVRWMAVRWEPPIRLVHLPLMPMQMKGGTGPRRSRRFKRCADALYLLMAIQGGAVCWHREPPREPS